MDSLFHPHTLASSDVGRLVVVVELHGLVQVVETLLAVRALLHLELTLRQEGLGIALAVVHHGGAGSLAPINILI